MNRKILLIFIFLCSGSISASDLTVKGLAKVYNTPASAIKWVQESLEYKTDQEVHNRAEYWQTSEETLKLMTVDCEDSAVLISDILKEFGIESVILCMYERVKRELVGHAICVYGYNDKLYIADNNLHFELNKGCTIADICKAFIKEWTLYRIYKTKYIRKGRNKAIRSGWRWKKKKEYIF